MFSALVISRTGVFCVFLEKPLHKTTVLFGSKKQKILNVLLSHSIRISYSPFVPEMCLKNFWGILGLV